MHLFLFKLRRSFGVGALQIFRGIAPSQVGEEDSPGGEIPI
ncbi:hypothetical protein XMD530_000507 [Marinobacterium sp. xm-d-530]|nr:hypothetical protein [Marinobacterium sp. xm-d-530]